MRFTETPIAGVWIIDIEPVPDERGFFARLTCRDDFARRGLNSDFVQQSISWNPHVGTLRGLHYQAEPYGEEKVVRVTQGAVFDVVVDIRRKSASFGKWFGVDLSADNRRQLYIPNGVAHGFQTLEDQTEIYYQMTAPYRAGAAQGILWSDPELKISWPLTTPTIMSEKDRGLPLLREIDLDR